MVREFSSGEANCCKLLYFVYVTLLFSGTLVVLVV